jgi:3-hydroxyisobutyrate dehydrogenase-like beta-hydroxyacid dehydrogenase
MKVAFAGLGVMGYPMAGFLAGAGHDVTVFNRFQITVSIRYKRLATLRR